MTMSFDLGLMLVTDLRLAGGRPLEEIVASAVRGGITAVQLRDKGASTRALLETALRILRLLEGTGIPLIVNDRADVALAARAAGAHLGQADLPAADARRMLGPEAVVGLSIETLEQAADIAADVVTYLGVSPVFATPTKADASAPWGIAGLRALRERTALPLVAIGGIHAGNAAEVLAAGADGLAVVSAICAAPAPEAAARRLRGIVDAARAEGRRR